MPEDEERKAQGAADAAPRPSATGSSLQGFKEHVKEFVEATPEEHVK